MDLSTKVYRQSSEDDEGFAQLIIFKVKGKLFFTSLYFISETTCNLIVAVICRPTQKIEVFCNYHGFYKQLY